MTTLIPLFAATPAVSEKAPDFSLPTPEGKQVRLSEMNARGTVVLVVLRGYPGYQCPYCNRQVQDFIRNASAIADAGARVLLVYPGPPQHLKAKAKEFLSNKALPENMGWFWTLTTRSPGSMGSGGIHPLKRRTRPPS